MPGVAVQNSTHLCNCERYGCSGMPRLSRLCRRGYRQRKIDDVPDHAQAEDTRCLHHFGIYFFRYVQRERPQALGTGEHDIRVTRRVLSVSWDPHWSCMFSKGEPTGSAVLEQVRHDLQQQLWTVAAADFGIKRIGD